MATGPWIDRSTDDPYVGLRCACGWEGRDADVEAWEIQRGNDRAVRICPACETPVPEWGTLRGLEGARRVARGPLQRALDEAGVREYESEE